MDFRCIFLMFSLVSTVALGAAARAETITLRADRWCPYNCDPKSATPGYMIEIVKAALEPLGHTVDYDTLNWARAILETREGKYTGIVGAAQTDAPDFRYPAQTLGSSTNCFFVKPTSVWEYRDETSLTAFPIGVIKDYTYSTAVDRYIKENRGNPQRIDEVAGDNPLELNLRKLAAGRIGAFLEDRYVANFLFNAKGHPPVKSAGCVKETPIYVGFGPKNPHAAAYAQLVSDKVVAMRKDGSLKILLAKYGIEDWVK